MSYKTILVHVDDSKHVDKRIEIAANIAAIDKAHLVGVAITGLPGMLYNTALFDPAPPHMAALLGPAQEHAAAALVKFENLARRFPVGSIETRLIENETAEDVSLQARYSDLVVLGQYDPEDASSSMGPDFVETVIMHSGVPVLTVPYASAFSTGGDRALIAWNASKEAARAVHDALPLLQRARQVDVAVFDPESQPVAYRAVPDKDIVDYLARHHIDAKVTRQKTGGDIDIGNALLSLAADLTSDLLVMGCYGHSRFREIVLGGVTRVILKSMTIPVLMTH